MHSPVSLDRRVNAPASTLALAALLACAATPGRALVNPRFQPKEHLFDRYKLCLACRVESVDAATGTAALRVLRPLKGALAPQSVRMSLAADVLESAMAELKPGETLVVFALGPTRLTAQRLMLYAGSGRWFMGSVAGQGEWTLTTDADKGLGSDSFMFGTFSGETGRLVEMMADAAAGTLYFPALPFEAFAPDRELGKLGAAVAGVALYDIDGDGRIDACACSPAGLRVYLQRGALLFEESSARLGLSGVAGTSLGMADANADGRVDLLVDGRLHQQREDGVFAVTDALPTGATGSVRSATFADANGDGYPDIVVSRTGAGLHLYLNPGTNGTAFTDATRASRLDRDEHGAGGDGSFAVGDWDGDGRIDIFYACGEGLLLTQTARSHFERAGSLLPPEAAGGEDAAQWGVPAFGALWQEGRLGVAVPEAQAIHLLADRAGVPTDVAPYGNETGEPTHDQWMALAEDLNADGTVDLYISSRAPSTRAVFLSNRGYGSFMHVEKYAGRGRVFPSQAYNRGATALAAADVDGDGATDLLIGGVDGTLSLLVNDTLRRVGASEHPNWHEAKRLQTRVVTVRVRGPLGVCGATVAFRDATGRTVALRQLGIGTGDRCRGPDQTSVAVREPGDYTVAVRYSDGRERLERLTLGSTSPRHQTLTALRP